jgi:hypothetical protein
VRFQAEQDRIERSAEYTHFGAADDHADSQQVRDLQ